MIKLATYSKWATPTVLVSKRNEKIRLCNVFKVTLNKFPKFENHPLLNLEYIITTLGGGVHFTKIDLNQASSSVTEDKKSQKLLIINTPKGLFQFLKLPMGLTSSPAIRQRKN